MSPAQAQLPEDGKAQEPGEAGEPMPKRRRLEAAPAVGDEPGASDEDDIEVRLRPPSSSGAPRRVHDRQCQATRRCWPN